MIKLARLFNKQTHKDMGMCRNSKSLEICGTFFGVLIPCGRIDNWPKALSHVPGAQLCDRPRSSDHPSFGNMNRAITQCRAVEIKPVVSS